MTQQQFLDWCAKHADVTKHYCNIVLDDETLTSEQRNELIDELTCWREALVVLSRATTYELQTPRQILDAWERCIEWEQRHHTIDGNESTAKELATIKFQDMYNELMTPPVDECEDEDEEYNESEQPIDKEDE